MKGDGNTCARCGESTHECIDCGKALCLDCDEACDAHGDDCGAETLDEFGEYGDCDGCNLYRCAECDREQQACLQTQQEEYREVHLLDADGLAEHLRAAGIHVHSWQKSPRSRSVYFKLRSPEQHRYVLRVSDHHANPGTYSWADVECIVLQDSWNDEWEGIVQECKRHEQECATIPATDL
jgi:hypothetical protein